MSELLRADEVSQMTRVPLETLRYWRWRGRGEAPASFKIGRRVVYRRDVVEQWLRDREAAAQDGAA